MSYFEDVLNLVPTNWEDESYSDKRYVLSSDISSDTEEYKNLIKDFETTSFGQVVSIQRIQHPFAYAHFHLEKERLQKIHGSLSVNEKRVFESVRGELEHVKLFLDYNCDSRRDIDHSVNKYVVVKKVLLPQAYRDHSWYPEYLIECKQPNENPPDENALQASLELQ